MKGTFAKLALATLLATGLATAAWAWDDSLDAGSGCCGTAPGKYRMSNGKWTNIRPAHKQASAAKPRATTPAKRAAPKPRKKVNFTLKKK